METAKDKAKSLVEKFMEDTKYFDATYIGELTAIECAKIAVDEILSINHNVKCDAGERIVNAMEEYWQEVKNELNKM